MQNYTPLNLKSSANQGLFKGRLNRANYLLGSFIIIAFIVFFFLIGLRMALNQISGNVVAPYILLTTFFLFAAIFYGYSFNIRRAHDLNWSGWSILLTLLPIFGFIFLFVLSLKKGTNGSNRYGNVNSKLDFQLLFLGR